MKNQPRRVLILGADGLRPDLLDATLLPTVAHLAKTGVRCWDHHAVYPTHTRVNMSTLTTGTTPGRHGLMANTMIVPHATEDHIIDTSNYQHLNALEKFSGGHALFVPSLGDRLAARGERLAVAATSSPGAAMLWTHRHLDRMVNTNSAYGIADLYDLREKLGEVPPQEKGAQIAAQRYATKALLRLLLDDPLNRVIVLWLNEPDTSQHYFGLGSPEAITALRTVDQCVAEILAALAERGLREQFAIFFISDHGHSTVQAHQTLRTYLAEAFKAIGYSLPLVTASDYIYTQPGAQPPSAAELAPLVAWLLAQPWAGVVFGGRPDLAALPGVLPLTALWDQQSNGRVPLLAVSPRWSHAPNEFGVPGQVMALTTQAALRASHGSASPFDLHATFIANGPDFHTGHNSTIPTGAVDLLPTVLTLLDLPSSTPLDGRVLWELWAKPQGEPGDVQRLVVEPTTPASKATCPAQVAFHRVGQTTYLHGALQADAFYTTQGP
ncbi:MAG: alkaline phosphatase family protein [Caldilineaceae bacterium]|nr:alkaline phosphatase family protein [Caldilineaceae bacterium]